MSSRGVSSFCRTLLSGVRVVELGGLAPVPHCGLVLADFGADVTVIEKANEVKMVESRFNRGKEVVHMDLKNEEDLSRARKMISDADVLLDPFRPGVIEKLGLDPIDLLQDNEGLIVCRLTGWGQTGPQAMTAGHDINYVALSGVLPTAVGSLPGVPWPPGNLLADFAGGALTAAFGVAAALFRRSRNGGKGCVMDVAMTDGLAYLSSFFFGNQDMDLLFGNEHAFFSSKCPVYRNYECKDGKFMSVGALEPKFSVILLKTLGLNYSIPELYEKPQSIMEEMESIFKTKTRDEWEKIFEGSDGCAFPVLDLKEVGDHPHHVHRGTFFKENGMWQPTPQPRFYSAEEWKELRKSSKL